MEKLSITEAHKRLVLATEYLSADETSIKVIAEDKKGTTCRGYYFDKIIRANN